MVSKVLLPRYCFRCNQVIAVDFILPDYNYFLLKGKVYSPKHEPLPNAAIEVIRTYKELKLEQSMGITFTDEEGAYGIALPRYAKCDYILVAYSPVDSRVE